MSLKDHSFSRAYNKEDTDIAKEFYLPCMSEATKYDRATGYFGSTVYLLSWTNLKSFVERGGKMRLLCSPYLSQADQDAIEEGLKGRLSEDLNKKLFKEFIEIFGKDELPAPDRVLACLISEGIIDIKLAVGRKDLERLFHDKAGVFYDNENAVAFRGSINETFKGISDDGNFESFDVFVSWGDDSDIDRLNGVIGTFDKIWNNESPSIRSIEIPSEIKKIIKTHATKQTHWEEALDEVTTTIDKRQFWAAEKWNGGRKPKEHQIEALENWAKNNYKGILEHATGSGKTYTALCAIRKHIENNLPVIVLVPSVGLLEQWRDELSAAFADIDPNILLCGDGNNLWKQSGMLQTWTSPDLNYPRIVLAMMGTASTSEFKNSLITGDHLMVVADEVHRMGSAGNRKFFTVNSGRRLGLSATPRRYGDKEGTQAIIDYFDKILQPPFTLQDAINNEILTKYFYYPEVVTLTDEEQESWNDISRAISSYFARLVGSIGESEALNNSRLKMLILKRCSIVKNAHNKIELARRVIKDNYVDGQRWIVYCENQEQVAEVLSAINDLPCKSYEYHSSMSGSRDETLQYFQELGGVIVSIRCLDEGIDIPATTHALILASSQNPREYIQRRGRILRRSEGKHLSFLYDAIVLPNGFVNTDKEGKIIQTELARAIQFGGWAENPSCITKLKIVANDNNVDITQFENSGIEDE